MKTYVKPLLLANDELAEGVYAASGDCWTVAIRDTQPWDGNCHVFYADMTHPSGLQHISNEQRVKLVFNDEIIYAESNAYEMSYSGREVILIRYSHGNAYGTGDQASIMVKVKAGDEARTKAITCVSSVCTYCDRADNVQGGND